MPKLIYKQPDGTEKALQLSAKPLIIGRIGESEIQVRDPFISRVHCSIAEHNKQFQIKDLGSANGTYCNGARVFECSISSGDRIQVGNTILAFEINPSTGDGILQLLSKPSMPIRPLNMTGPISLPQSNSEEKRPPNSP